MWQNVAYNQPPHPGFYLGHGMDTPPVPEIYLVKEIKLDMESIKRLSSKYYKSSYLRKDRIFYNITVN